MVEKKRARSGHVGAMSASPSTAAPCTMAFLPLFSAIYIVSRREIPRQPTWGHTQRRDATYLSNILFIGSDSGSSQRVAPRPVEHREVPRMSSPQKFAVKV